MGQTRKPLAEQKGHLTVEQQQRKELEEKIVTVGKDHLQKPPTTLRDRVAKDEWKRVVKEFEKIDIIGNLDLANLIGYCNAYSLYIQVTKELKGQPLIVDAVKNGFTVKAENPLLKLQRDYAKQMREFESTLGLTISTRLKAATEKVNKEEKNIEEEFGDI